MRVSTVLLLALAAISFAHMELIVPPAFLSKFNPNTLKEQIDYSMKNPLASDGSNFPCKGYLKVLNSPQGASVATWQAGSQQTWMLDGETRHEGGSCQASISKDGGNTFKVVHSYIGGCPLVNSYGFKVPSDTPAGPAIFAFTWNNRVGNRELYMNCASVTITGGGGRESVTFNSRPNILRAHADGGQCRISGGMDVNYPDPGPDVTRYPKAKLETPAGNCGPTGSGGGGGGDGGVSPSPSSGGGTDSGQDPFGGYPPPSGNVPISDGGCPFGISPPVPAIQGLIPSANRMCGQQYTCINSIFGSCCNAQGMCGNSDEDCGAGCQGPYGRCCDAQGNPNVGFRGRSSAEKEARIDCLVKWTAAVVALGAIWRTL